MKPEGKNGWRRSLKNCRGPKSIVLEKTNEEIAREYGLKTSEIVKLNYHENLYIPRANK